MALKKRVIASISDCHPEHQRGISREVLVARLATMTFEKIPRCRSG
jgi:hypothetical protein